MFFSDFCLEKEEEIFFGLKNGLYDVIGLGYGCFEASEYVFAQIQKQKRMQKLLLISPIIDIEAYRQNIMPIYQNSPYQGYLKKDKKVGVRQWDKERLEFIARNEVKIEVYLGRENKEYQDILELFGSFALIYCFNRVAFPLVEELKIFKK